jgi:hypothetical protein
MNETNCTCPKLKCERHGNVLNAENITEIKNQDVREIIKLEKINHFGKKYLKIKKQGEAEASSKHEMSTSTGLRSSRGVDALANKLADDVLCAVVDSDKREAERNRGRL